MAMNWEFQFLHICTNYSLANFRRLKCFFLYSIYCTDVFTVSCKLFQRPRVCYLRMKWLRGRESEWVFSSRWSHCGYTTIETLWFFFQGKKRRFFNRWSNFTKQQRERRRAFVGSLERMLVSSMLNNWKQHVKENKALRWVDPGWLLSCCYMYWNGLTVGVVKTGSRGLIAFLGPNSLLAKFQCIIHRQRWVTAVI